MDEISPKGEAAVVVGSRAHLVKTEAVIKVRLLSHPVCTPLSPRSWDTWFYLSRPRNKHETVG